MPDTSPRFACPDWWERIQAGDTPMPDVPVNAEKAARVLAFFNRLRLPDVAGTPALKEAAGDWFRDMLVAFLASEDPETGRRLVWELLCMVPKKNSKTTYVAALGLTALYFEKTPNAQMLIIAPSHNISQRCFEQAAGMIRLDPQLRQIFAIQDHLSKITRRSTGAKINVKTFDTSIVTGEIPVLTIIDELHELGRKPAAVQVMQQIRGGGITTTGGQVLMITTQSDRRPAGIWKSELQKARAIRDGRGGAGPILLPVLYEFPEALQKDEAFWRDRANWPALLPNRGRSIDVDRLEADYDNNGKASAEAEQVWVSQHLNIEIGLGLHSDRWIGADYWPSAADQRLDFDTLLETSEVVVVGGDIGGADDLFSLAFLGRHRDTGTWQAWSHSWAVEDVLDLRKDIASALRDFEADGDLTLTQGAAAHVQQAADMCLAVADAGLLPDEAAIGLDPYGVAALVAELEARGIAKEQIAGVKQGGWLSGTIQGLERRLLDGTLRHGGQPILDWSISNAKTEMRGNNLMITKQTAGSAKIDPLIALFNAASLMDRSPVASRMNLDRFLSDVLVAAQ